MSGISGVFDVAQTRAQQFVLNVSGAPAGDVLSYYYGLTPFAGSPVSTVDANGEMTVSFTSANGMQPATTYAVGVIAQKDGNHNESSVVTWLADGYTAYATTVFGDYMATVHCASCSGSSSGDTLVNSYTLTALLDDASNSVLRFSLTHNAGVAPTYPASEVASSGDIAGRTAAPVGVTAVNVSSPTSYNGEIQLTGALEYRIHGTTAGWNTATNTAASLGSGNYDVRYPAVAGVSCARRKTTVAIGAEDLQAFDNRITTTCDALPLMIDVLPNDVLPASCTSPVVSIVSHPAHVIATIDGNNRIIYSSSQSSLDTLAYRVACGSDYDEAKVYVSVEASAFVDDL
jgi:hypothetical protein